MKKTLSLVLALVMLMAMFAAVGAAEPAEAAVQPDAAEPDVQAEETEVAAAPVEEAPAEPAPAAEPEAEPEAVAEPETAAEEPAEPEVPAEPEAPVEPAEEPEIDEPEVAEPAEEPADNGIATVAELPAENDAPTTIAAPEPTPLPTVDVHANGGYFPAPRTGYEKLTVTLDENGKLPKTDGEGYPEPGWYTPQRDGWTFKGWYTDPETTGQPIHEGDSVNGATKLYAGWEELPHIRTVTLNANPGYIKHNDAAEKLYKDWCGAADQSAGLDWDNGVTMIDVALTDGNLPADVAELSLVRDGWTFKGWYTQPPTEQLVSEEGYSYWTTETNGRQVQPSNAVDEDTQVLYAAYDQNGGSESGKMVTFYLDWNGINGLWGHCLTCTRPYDDGKVTFTAKDALVIGLNYKADKADDGKADDGTTFDDVYGEDQVTWENLKAFWEGRTFNGYKFLGWFTEPTNGEEVNSDKQITDGMSFYAHWTKGESGSSDTFERVDPAAGPLTGLRIVGGLDSSMSASVHAGEGAAFTLSLFRSPVRAEVKDVTWTIDVVKAASSPTEVFKNKKETITVKADGTGKTEDGGIELKAEGLNLTITCANGEAYSVTVSAAATGKDDKTKTTDSAATVSFYHTAGTWVQKEAPTCVKSGVETTTCAVCGKELSRKIVPLEHQWKFEVTKTATCTTDGLAQDKCTRCGVTFDQYQTGADKDVTPPDKTQVLPATGHSYCGQATCTICGELGKKGDPSGDGIINTNDVRNLFLCAMNGGDGIAPEIGDVTGDGVINTNDVRVLFLAAMNDGSLPG